MAYIETIRQKRRIVVMMAGVIGLGATLLVRLAYIQIGQHKQYLAQAAREHSRKYEIAPARGQIYFMDGDQKSPAALNQSLSVLYADSKFIEDPLKVSRALAAITGDDANSYYQTLKKGGEYLVLKRRVGTEMTKAIKALNLSGVGLADQHYRTYPEGNLAAQVLGFVNSDGVGQYGAEGFLDSDLGGVPGLLSAKTDTRGIPIATADNVVKAPVNGKSYVLTIDRNIQAAAEKYLKEGVESTRADSGSVVIIDPSTGAVKAMANFPTFDPNSYGQTSNYSVFSNSVTTNQFEPGSGFKVFTMATGLETGKIRPETTFNDSGAIELDGRTIDNAEHKHYGVRPMTDVIRLSLNTGVIFILKSLGGDPNKITIGGKKVFHDFITNHFGFGVRTGIEQTGEAAGSVAPPSTNDVTYANMTFGQGVSVTMMQMAVAVASIANGGKLYQPHLIAQVIDADGKPKITQPKLVNDQVISPKTSSELVPMMQQVVEHGSGYAAQIKGYKVAGKTGTAQIPRSDGKGYETDKNIGSFVGFAPVEAPRFVMMVRVNNPKVQGFAESTAVPVFGKIAQFLLRYYAVPPSS